MHDEKLDLVDEEDQVIGVLSRSEVYARGLHNIRVVNLFVVNNEGNLWIPRRTAHKKLYPLHLDMSMGGHVMSGEKYDEAFSRETQEELRIDVAKTPYRFLRHLTPHEHGVSAFMNVYEITQDAAPDYNTDDFMEYFWLTPRDLLAWIASGEKTKSDLPKLIKIFYSHD